MVPVRLRRFMSSKVADWLVRIAVIVSVIVSSFSAWQLQNLTSCVARYNDANNTRSVVLTEATNQERMAERRADDAQAALFLNPAVSKPAAQRTAAERAEILRLFRAYQTALSDQKTERAAADDARVDHPIPDPPSEVCG
jgi:hypothetical protein